MLLSCLFSATNHLRRGVWAAANGFLCCEILGSGVVCGILVLVQGINNVTVDLFGLGVYIFLVVFKM